MRLLQRNGRCGTLAVEAAIVLPVLVLLVFGLIVGGTGVFRYQQVAFAAREGARYACVRGADYQRQTMQTPPTTQQILQQAIMPFATGMDPAAVTVVVQWIDNGANVAWAWDSATKEVRSIASSGQYVSNSVSVTVQYKYQPGLLWGSMTLQSTTVVPMSF